MKIRVLKVAFIFLVHLLYAQNGVAQICGFGGDQNGKLGNQTVFAYVVAYWVVIGYTVLDPNDIQGQQGYGIKKYVTIKDKLGYTISFENDGQFADAPAQNVYIYFPIPDSLKLDINSLKLGNFGFGKYDFQVPDNNASSYTTRLDLRDSLNIYVDVTAGIDIANKQLFWFFKSIDPVTGIAPNDARGFLAVSDTGAAKLSDTTSKGQGFVNFYITPKQTAVTGDTIPTQASIVFDTNGAIPTNVWDNTIDAVAPTSRVVSDTATGNIIIVTWNGRDDPGGSGVRDYELYASENGGPFKLYKSNITDTFINYEGTPGSLYCFFTLATDNTGNKENLKKDCEATVTLSLSGGALPVTWLYFNGRQAGNDVLLNWATATEINTKEFIIERSLDGTKFKNIGNVAATNNPSSNNYQSVDPDAMSQNVSILYYRLREVDIDGKFKYSIIVAIPIHAQGQPSVSAYPNPFDQTITLKVMNVTATDKINNVSLFSIEGRRLYSKNLGIIGPSTILLQDLPGLLAGEYILEVTINGKLYTVKMVKMNR